MLEVGCPEPALVDERTESTRSWAASSATTSRPVPDAIAVVVIGNSCYRRVCGRAGVRPLIAGCLLGRTDGGAPYPERTAGRWDAPPTSAQPCTRQAWRNAARLATRLRPRRRRRHA